MSRHVRAKVLSRVVETCALSLEKLVDLEARLVTRAGEAISNRPVRAENEVERSPSGSEFARHGRTCVECYQTHCFSVDASWARLPSHVDKSGIACAVATVYGRSSTPAKKIRGGTIAV
jgi:hypothetical protein